MTHRLFAGLYDAVRQIISDFTVAIEKDTSILSAINVQVKELHAIKSDHLLVQNRLAACIRRACQIPRTDEINRMWN